MPKEEHHPIPTVSGIMHMPWTAMMEKNLTPLQCSLLLPKSKHYRTTDIANILQGQGIDAIADDDCVMVPVYERDGSHANYNAFRQLAFAAHSPLGPAIEHAFKRYNDFLKSPDGQKKYAELMDQDEALQQLPPPSLLRAQPFGGGIFKDAHSRSYIIPAALEAQHKGELEELIKDLPKGVQHKHRYVDGLEGKALVITANPDPDVISRTRDETVRTALTEFASRHPEV